MGFLLTYLLLLIYHQSVGRGKEVVRVAGLESLLGLAGCAAGAIGAAWIYHKALMFRALR